VEVIYQGSPGEIRFKESWISALFRLFIHFLRNSHSLPVFERGLAVPPCAPKRALCVPPILDRAESSLFSVPSDPELHQESSDRQGASLCEVRFEEEFVDGEE
jgi:hypothetical protein